MISMLRLINPPGSKPRRGFTIPMYAGGTRRRAQQSEAEWFSPEITTPTRRKRVTKPKKTVRSRSRTRTTTIKRDKQGRFVKRTTTKRTVVSNPKARRKGAKSMPKKKTVRRRVRRNPVAVKPVKRRRTVKRVRRNPTMVTKRVVKRNPGTSAGARKAARTRAANKAKRSAIARKAARTRARNRAAAARASTSKATTRRRTFTPRRRKGKVVGTMKARYAPQSRRRATHKIRRTVGRLTDRSGKGRVFYRYTVSRNPGTAMKNMLVDGVSLYGGYVGAKALSGLLNEYVLKNPSIAPTVAGLGQFASVLPSAASFFLAAFAGKAIKNPKVVSSLQTGATLAFLQSVVGAVLPATVRASLPPFMATALSGIDDMGFRGYGEYIQQRQPMGAYVREAMAGNMGEYIQQRPQLGAYVDEAMALDEYIQQPSGMSGFDVQEALADSEVQGMQSGYAAGSLAKTAFSNF